MISLFVKLNTLQIFSSSADNVLGTYSHVTSCRKKQERGGAK